MNTNNLLVELGTEELPPKALRKLATEFADEFTAELDKAELPHGEVRWYASPRRLAIYVEKLGEAQPDKVVEKRGPAVSVAFDADGNPTKAAQGWARSNGINVEQAERLKTDKGEWLLHRAEVKGQTVQQLAEPMLKAAVKRLPIPKPMRWGANTTEFIRPVHTFTLLYGSEIVEAELLGIQSDRNVQGHRFHSEGLLPISHADQYVDELAAQGRVMADFEARRSMIEDQVKAAAAQEGGVADLDPDLLDEVTALVEWPTTYVGSFETEFLAVPAEALIYTMKDNQKYFPVLDQNGKLLPRFIFVSNIKSKDPQQVISGNEKVVRPRLADAEFFFKTDQKTKLIDRVETLGTVLFQKQLGTLKDKSERISQLSGEIATQLGGDAAQASRAGLLCKADLMSEMVMEFTDIQGTMGMYYARIDGEDEAVAQALHEQYMPRFAGDELPTSTAGVAVAIADKMDTLVGIFGIGQAPKGDKDPFALRRAAIGILRIAVEKQLPLDIETLAQIAAKGFGDKLTNSNVVADVVDFMLARFRAWYQEQSVSVDVIQAVLAKRPTAPADFDTRVKAVAHFRSLPQAEALAAANKRVSNILAKVEGNLPQSIDASLLTEAAEQALAETLAKQSAAVTPLFAQGEYQAALTQLASLQQVIDNFFDNVMVMAEDDAVRSNRIALLNQLRQLFMHVADISLLQG